MMALAPSNNAKKEEISDEFRNMKTFVLSQDHDQHSEMNSYHPVKQKIENVESMFSGNPKHSQQQVPDEAMIEQLYQFDQYRNGVPAAPTANAIQRRYTEGMPMISIGGVLNNRHRQSVHENVDIQLPLIGTNRSRLVSKNLVLRKTAEPLDALPLKRQRNLNNCPPISMSNNTNQGLVNLRERGTRVLIEPLSAPKPTDSLLRMRSLSKEEPQAVLSPPVPIPEFDSDHHQTFQLLIQNGVTKNQAENFLQFQQFYYCIWGNIIKIFRQLEKLMSKYLIPLALINGERVAELAQSPENDRKPTLEELLSTIINRDELEKLIKQPGRRFFGNNGKERAALLIQSYWRGYHARRTFQQLKKRQWAAQVITSCWLKHSKLSKIRQQLERTRLRQLNLFHKKQTELREKWTQISSHRRIVVHIPSLGLTNRLRRKLSNLSIRENYRIGCLCELEDPNIDVIYVSPMPINQEILQYYDKLINLRALVEHGNEQANVSNNVNERFLIIVPEALNRFPGHHMCLATLLKYSPKALKQIKTLINNRQAYLITGVSHIDDLHISEYLNIPIYGCEPEVSYLYSTKSGSKRIFKSSNVPIPFGEYDIYNQKHLFEALARLIVEHSDIQRWIFKIDDHFDGLGIAYCDIAVHLPSYSDLIKGENQSIQKGLYEKILSELPDVLERYTVYVNQSRFHSWQSYLKVFLSQGGIIEAYPPNDSFMTTTVCLTIEPNDRYSLICSGDQLHAESQFSCWGLVFPQSSTDPNRLNTYCSLIVEQCKQRNIYGHIDIDFLIFTDPKTEKQNIWVSDLSIGYSEHVSLYYVMRYITTGEFHPETHSYLIKSKQIKQRLRNWQNGAPTNTIIEKNCYAVWSSKLHHKNLANIHYSIFFQICRSHGIGFDIREKQGSIFTLLECDQHENLGMITISDTLQSTLRNFLCYLNAINQELTRADTQEESNFLSAVNDIENRLNSTQGSTSWGTSTS